MNNRSKRINFTGADQVICDALDKLPPAFRAVYRDKAEAANYRGPGSFFSGKKESEIIAMITAEAVKAGLPKKLIPKFKQGADFHAKPPKPKQADAEIFEYWFDANTGISFARENLYRLETNARGTTEKFLCNIPMKLLGVIDKDGEMQVRYRLSLDGDDRQESIREMVSHIAVCLRTTREDNKYLTALLYAYVNDRVTHGQATVEHSPIYVNGGVIHCISEEGQDVAGSLSLLRQFYDDTMHREAYLSSFAYSLTAPLHYNVRVMSPAGYILPHHVSVGRTGAAKTTTTAIFVLTGWNQGKDQGILMSNQVRTPFTFMKHLSHGLLPVMVNDISPEWLDKVSDELKSASEAPAIGDRGNPDQTVTHKEMTRSILVTMNADISPSDDAARNRRYILERYTEMHEARRNLPAYTAFMSAMKPGFLFGIFRELFNDRPVLDVVNEIIRTGDAAGFVNYGIDKINSLCDRYGVPKFPAYKQTAGNDAGEFAVLCEYLIDQWKRLNATDDNGHPTAPYAELSKTELDVHEFNSLGAAVIIWFTGAGYRIAARRLGLRYATATDFFNNFVTNGVVTIEKRLQSHRFNGVAVKAFALGYSGD